MILDVNSRVQEILSRFYVLCRNGFRVSEQQVDSLNLVCPLLCGAHRY